MPKTHRFCPGDIGQTYRQTDRRTDRWIAASLNGRYIFSLHILTSL